MENLIVRTSAGKVQGLISNQVYIFRGIPYAAPPVGERRWLPPLPRAAWEGVRPALEFGPVAPQAPTRVGGIGDFAVNDPQNEDCLYLNIWTPGLDPAKRPVMVWIHGGAFSMGSGSQSVFEGSRLAKAGNVVVITLNYRLGLLGFLNLSEITGGRIPAMGNEGLLDQIAALKWIRENISAFGGDPENITLFGESAGAMSIGCLMVMPKARGLFHKAILESGAASTARSLEASVKASRLFLEVLGLQPADVQTLRNMTVEQIISAQEKLALQPGFLTSTVPVIDGDILPGHPLSLLEAGLGQKIPVLAGTNLDEMKLFSLMHDPSQPLDESALEKRCRNIAPAELVRQLIETYRLARARRGQPVNPEEIWLAILTDLRFRIPAVHLLEAQCRNSLPAYNYLFTWKSPLRGGQVGACHALEVGFIFGNFGEDFCGSGPRAEKLSAAMQDAWTAFARKGDPGCPSLGDWPQYCSGRKTMLLGDNPHVEAQLFEEERLFISHSPDSL